MRKVEFCFQNPQLGRWNVTKKFDVYQKVLKKKSP